MLKDSIDDALERFVVEVFKNVDFHDYMETGLDVKSEDHGSIPFTGMSESEFTQLAEKMARMAGIPAIGVDPSEVSPGGGEEEAGYARWLPEAYRKIGATQEAPSVPTINTTKVSTAPPSLQNSDDDKEKLESGDGDIISKNTSEYGYPDFLDVLNKQEEQGFVKALSDGMAAFALEQAMVGGIPTRWGSNGGSSTRTSKRSSSYGKPHISRVRDDFPIFNQKVNGKPLIWFDNGATTQKPYQVIDAVNRFSSEYYSNIHRGAHQLAKLATEAYEEAREKVREFLGAKDTDEIIFVRGTTEAINLVAKTWGWQNISEGDEIILSVLEHHANIVPWQMLATEKGARLRVIPVDDNGEIVMEIYSGLFSPKTKLVAFTHASNAIGTIPPAEEMIKIAHSHGVPVLIDGAQAVAHFPVNVQGLDVDFYTFSGHKVFGPTGVGVLYGKRELLESMPPWQGGGSMIRDVTFEETIYNKLPEKFEAGTPMIAQAIGLKAALNYVMAVGIEQIASQEQALTQYALMRLQEIPGLKLIGRSKERIGVLSFLIDGIAPERVGAELDRNGIAVRVGHHCAQPIHRRFGIEGSIRPSLALYNTKEEIDLMIDILKKLIQNLDEFRVDNPS
jgi:SufS family cysteine desulfurase